MIKEIINWYEEFKTNEGLLKVVSEMSALAKYSIDNKNFFKYLELREYDKIDELREKLKTDYKRN